MGAYVMAHDERSGDTGVLVLLSMHPPDGVLIEYFDENMENFWLLSIEGMLTTGTGARLPVSSSKGTLKLKRGSFYARLCSSDTRLGAGTGGTLWV